MSKQSQKVGTRVELSSKSVPDLDGEISPLLSISAQNKRVVHSTTLLSVNNLLKVLYK